MSAVDRGPRRGVLLAAAVVVLAAASTVAVAAASGAFTEHRPHRSCSVPALPGRVVTARLIDMRAMMGGGGMGGGPMLHQHDWPAFRHGMMRLALDPATVAHGTVSLRVENDGYLTHELVVLPLGPGAVVGARTPGPDGQVDETGSLGEASASCAGGAGDGIAPGSAGWVTLHLPAGRYEVICNLPGHYVAGMYAELDVSS